MTTTFRHMFSRLVSALIAENKKDSALAALDYCMKVIPSTTVPHSYVSVILAGQYLQLNQKEKAFAILDDLKKNSLQYLNWIANLKPSMRKSAMNDLEENLGIYSEVVRIEEKDADKETFEKDYQNLKRFSEIYNSYRR